MMGLLSGAKAIKNVRHRKQKLEKNLCLLAGTHQDGGIGVFPKTKKKRQKIFFLTT